jgi:hypothetical protein
MAREEFIDNLRLADQLFAPMKTSWPGGRTSYFSGDPWLTPNVVDGFDPADFADWPKEEREKLKSEIAAFLGVAKDVPPDGPATPVQRRKAREHLEAAMKVVRPRLLKEWREAQEKMLQEATSAARAEGWYVEKDEKKIEESLLGEYYAPRLRIRTPDKEVVLDPIACFGSGRQGIVDLVVLPTYETAYLIVFRRGDWRIVSYRKQYDKPFTAKTLVHTITRLSND